MLCACSLCTEKSRERDTHQIYILFFCGCARARACVCVCERRSLMLLLAAQIPCNKLNGTRCDETKHYTLSTLCIERVCVCVCTFYFITWFTPNTNFRRALLLYVQCVRCATPRARSYIRGERTNFHPTPHTHTHTHTHIHKRPECVFFAIAPARSPQARTYFTYCFIFVRLPHTFAAQTRSAPLDLRDLI